MDGQHANRGTYNERINSIKNKIAKVVKRYEDFQNTIYELQNLDQTLKNNEQLLNSLVTIILFRIKSTSM